jgi:hypothetical protein
VYEERKELESRTLRKKTEKRMQKPIRKKQTNCRK